MVLTKTKVIDCRDHLLGRLASIVSKELLAGQKIVLVRCDEMVISGSCECARASLPSGQRSADQAHLSFTEFSDNIVLLCMQWSVTESSMLSSATSA
jgi:ribosomal protein L13